MDIHILRHTGCAHAHIYMLIESMFLWFDSLSLQTFCVVRSQNNSPEMFKLEEPPCITPPLPSVPELSLKPQVKGASNLPVLQHQSEAG